MVNLSKAAELRNLKPEFRGLGIHTCAWEIITFHENQT